MLEKRTSQWRRELPEPSRVLQEMLNDTYEGRTTEARGPWAAQWDNQGLQVSMATANGLKAFRTGA